MLWKPPVIILYSVIANLSPSVSLNTFKQYRILLTGLATSLFRCSKAKQQQQQQLFKNAKSDVN